jgi:soluble lytic murein transglycosylase-like protein
MAALSLLAIPLAMAMPSSGDVARWSAEIDAAALRCGIPGDWIARVMQAESGGRTMLGGRPIRSRKGAIGLMQLMPGTWAELRRDLGLGGDPDLPADNIVAGACYLRRMYDRFGYPGLFGAYNAGPGRYAAWLAGESALPGETIAYLRSVSARAPMVAEPPAALPATLFVVRREARPSSVAGPSTPAMFVLRREVP